MIGVALLALSRHPQRLSTKPPAPQPDPTPPGRRRRRGRPGGRGGRRRPEQRHPGRQGGARQRGRRRHRPAGLRWDRGDGRARVHGGWRGGRWGGGGGERALVWVLVAPGGSGCLRCVGLCAPSFSLSSSTKYHPHTLRSSRPSRKSRPSGSLARMCACTATCGTSTTPTPSTPLPCAPCTTSTRCALGLFVLVRLGAFQLQRGLGMELAVTINSCCLCR